MNLPLGVFKLTLTTPDAVIRTHRAVSESDFESDDDNPAKNARKKAVPRRVSMLISTPQQGPTLSSPVQRWFSHSNVSKSLQSIPWMHLDQAIALPDAGSVSSDWIDHRPDRSPSQSAALDVANRHQMLQFCL